MRSSTREATATLRAADSTPDQNSAPLLPYRGRVISLNPQAPRRAMTEHEKHMLRLICDGMTNKEMALHLGVSTETVKSELKRIFRKIEVRNRTQAAVLLVKQGLGVDASRAASGDRTAAMQQPSQDRRNGDQSSV
jgi:DNA-binding CsgD family transcriptional regulator